MKSQFEGTQTMSLFTWHKIMEMGNTLVVASVRVSENKGKWNWIIKVLFCNDQFCLSLSSGVCVWWMI